MVPFLIVAALLAALAGWLVGKTRADKLARDLAVANERAGLLEKEHQSAITRLQLAVAEIEQFRSSLAERDQRVMQLETNLANLSPLQQTLVLRERSLTEKQDEIAALMERQGVLTGEATARQAQISGLLSEQQQLRLALEQLTGENSQLKSALAELGARHDAQLRQTEEKLALLKDAREQMGAQFHQLANEILDEKSKKFTEQNQTNIGGLLTPLHEKIKEFQQKVEETYDKESKERFSLSKEVQRLAELNVKIRDDAVNLTQALKGNNKTQGTWGEIVLERVLASSGLRRGQEYQIQASLAREDGGGQHRPDVVINLPEGKHLVIDSKMTLVAYERYANAENEEDRSESLRQHLTAVRNHVKQLGEKNYQTLHGLGALDFVLLFMPVEPAFMLAVTEDSTLFSDAFERNVLIVSPSTLLATLRTIANIWRQEYQNRNAQEIANQCGKLYDKFVGFVGDLESIGHKLTQTQKAYDDAHNKLAVGRGNLIRQAEQVRKLGVSPSKSLAPGMLDLALDDQGTAIEEI